MIRNLLTVFIALSLTCGVANADSLPLSQLPMYGEREKTDSMKNADAEFITFMDKRGLTRQNASKEVMQSGWASWAKRDLATAMSRFNQAWLLDPENGNTYHGFALATAVRGGNPNEVERLFKLSISKASVDAVAFVDYGRFLWTQKQLDKSLTLLNKALEISPKAFNARSNISFVYYMKSDFASACTWAKDAQKNDDELEKGYLEEMCSREKSLNLPLFTPLAGVFIASTAILFIAICGFI